MKDKNEIIYDLICELLEIIFIALGRLTVFVILCLIVKKIIFN